jgi:hypothetical protein
MTYDIRIKLKKNEVLPDVFDWIQQQGWKHIQEWRWSRQVQSSRYTFQFDDKKKAEWFSLRWT